VANELPESPKEDDALGYSVYYSVMNTLQYVIVHLTGDYPYTQYTWVGRVIHSFLMLAAAAFVAVPVGLFCACFQREMTMNRRLQNRALQQASTKKIGDLLRGMFIRRKLRAVVN
jgi:hypothetical protein